MEAPFNFATPGKNPWRRPWWMPWIFSSSWTVNEKFSEKSATITASPGCNDAFIFWKRSAPQSNVGVLRAVIFFY